MTKLERYIKKEFIKKLKPTYLKLVDKKRQKVHIGDRFCCLETWYSGFWVEPYEDWNDKKYIDEAIDDLVKIAIRECPLKNIALQKVEVDLSKIFKTFINIGITFGGY